MIAGSLGVFQSYLKSLCCWDGLCVSLSMVLNWNSKKIAFYQLGQHRSSFGLFVRTCT